MSEWQPIETAPKDGTKILVFCPEGGVQSADYDEREGGWCYQAFDEWGRAPIFGNPTHWMPLPDPPTLTKEG